MPVEEAGGHTKSWWLTKFGVFVAEISRGGDTFAEITLYKHKGQGMRVLYSASDAVVVMWEKLLSVVEQAELAEAGEPHEEIRCESDREAS